MSAMSKQLIKDGSAVGKAHGALLGSVKSAFNGHADTKADFEERRGALVAELQAEIGYVAGENKLKEMPLYNAYSSVLSTISTYKGKLAKTDWLTPKEKKASEAAAKEEKELRELVSAPVTVASAKALVAMIAPVYKGDLRAVLMAAIASLDVPEPKEIKTPDLSKVLASLAK